MNQLRYVYAVCRPFEAALQADLAGVGGAPLEQLEHGDLVAVLSPVPYADFGYEPLRAHLEDSGWLTETARTHQAVIAALTTVTCPLPLRLGTIFRDDSGVRTMLQDEGDQLRTLLSRIDGCVEWGVKVYAEPAAHPARAASFAHALHDELTARSAATRLHPPSLSRDFGRIALNGSYLVERSDCEEFVAHVERVGEQEPGLRVELGGPWAAYSFSDPEGGSGDRER